MINNTLSNTYSSLLKPNPKAVLPTNPSVPNILSKFPPAQSALNSKIGQPTTPSWQNTLSQVQSAPKAPNAVASPSVINPAQPNQNMTSIPASPAPTAGLMKAPVQNYANAGSLPVENPNRTFNENVNTGNGPVGSTVQPSTNPLNPNNGLVPPPAPTYPGLVGGLASFNPFSNPQVGDAYKRAQEINNQLSQSKRNEASAEATNRLNPIPIGDQTGREAVMRNQYLQQQNALASEFQGQSNLYQGGLTGTGQQLTGQTQAAGFAQPQLAGFNQQAFNPLTGGFSQGGSLQDAVTNVIGKLTKGEMTYNDAVSALSGYGQGGVNALQQALPQGFNIAQSNTLAGQQGSITPALNYANLALNHAKEVLGQLSVPGQTSNIGAVSDVANWFSNISGVGKEATRTKEGALAEARSAIQSVLASVKGGNPTEYRDQSYALLPNNATPADIDAAVANLQTLGSGKQNIYSNPGQSNTNNNATNNSTTTAPAGWL